MRAYTKDIIRTISKGRKRFFAIMMITALGVCMLCGIKAACDDLRYSADVFFDEQNLYDISIISTLGLTQEDITAVREMEGIEAAEGAYSEDVFINLDRNTRKKATVKTLSQEGINLPYLLEGRIPEKPDEILVTKKYINESGKKVGDVLFFQEDIKETNSEDEEETPNFRYSRYEISGIVIDVTDINSAEGVVTFRNNAATDYTFFVPTEAVESEVYTAMYLTLEETDELACYGDVYEQKVDEIVTLLEDEIKEDREQARYDEVTGEAWDKIAEAEEEMWEAFDEAEREIADAKAKIEDGWIELENGEDELSKAEREISQAERELLAGERELERGESELVTAEQEIASAETQLEMMELLFKETDKIFSLLETIQAALPEDNEQSVELIQKLEEGKAALAQSKNEVTAGRAELEAGKEQLAAAKQQLEDGWAAIESGWKELANGEQQIYDGWDELEDGLKELEDGQAKLQENLAEYESEKADALAEMEKAKQEISDLKMTEWYITTRTSLSGYNNIKTDADCIESIGNAFPVLFLTIAILISLTTMSRMIEEDRGLIGTYKALGFTDGEIRRKYISYALIACIIGGILGDFLGYIALPKFIFIVFEVMYQLPTYLYTFDILYGIGGIILFIAGIAGAAYLSCSAVLKSMPAMLMRAKAPSLGSRVLLERITPIWSKLSFLNKVTARNLFRYKKRLFMTLFGIAGCTSLLLAGFTIRDTVVELSARQYEETYRYDAMVVAEDNEKMLTYLEEQKDVQKYINVMLTNVKVMAESGKEETVQMVVIPKEENISRYIRLIDAQKEERQKITEDDVFVTKNLSMVAKFEEEDFVMIQTMDLAQSDVEVTKIVMNYLGNTVYMTQEMYEESFETKFEPNAAYVLLKTEGEKQNEFVEDLKGKDGILSIMSKYDMTAGFNDAFQIINMVVYIIIILAGALAFVVLFTLATTNISERERELATIKVLGFYDHEVHSYVNKETLILTGLGILLGLPLGKAFGIWLMSVLEMPSIYFYTALYPKSYVYAAGISLSFALIVNLMTNKSLNKQRPFLMTLM